MEERGTIQRSRGITRNASGKVKGSDLGQTPRHNKRRQIVPNATLGAQHK